MIIDSGVLAAIITGVISPILGWFGKMWVDKKKENKKDLLRETLTTSVEIENKLDEMLKDYEADRVYVTQFHNGGYYLTGKSIQKSSMVYETVLEGIDSMQVHYQNIPVSLFSRIMSDTSAMEMLYIDYDNNDALVKYNLKNLAEINKNRCSYTFAIRNIQGKMIGMLGLNYVNKKKKLTQQEISYIFSDVATVGGVLNGLVKK